MNISRKSAVAVGFSLALVAAGSLILYTQDVFNPSRDSIAKESGTNQTKTKPALTGQASISNSPVSNRQPLPFETPQYQAFINSEDFHSLYVALQLRTDPESLFYKASILDRCKGREGGQNLDIEANVKNFSAKLKGDFKDLRVAIFEEKAKKSNNVLCAKFNWRISDAEVQAAYEAAAKAGDTRAKLGELHQKLIASATPTRVSVQPLGGVTSIDSVVPRGPTEAEATLLRDALFSKDPTQILAAGNLLTARYSDFEVRLQSGRGIEGNFDLTLWRSVACHYAGGCPPDSHVFQQECALHGRCDATSYDEQLQRYSLNTESWQRFQTYRNNIIEAIDTQNWELLNVSRGTTTNIWGRQIDVKPLSPRFDLRIR